MLALTVSEVGVDVQWCMCNCATPRMTFFLPISFFFLLWRSVTFFFFSAFRCNCLPRFFFFTAFFFFLCIAMLTVAVVFVWLFCWPGGGGEEEKTHDHNSCWSLSSSLRCSSLSTWYSVLLPKLAVRRWRKIVNSSPSRRRRVKQGGGKKKKGQRHCCNIGRAGRHERGGGQASDLLSCFFFF